jgi:hypothetical protein
VSPALHSHVHSALIDKAGSVREDVRVWYKISEVWEGTVVSGAQKVGTVRRLQQTTRCRISERAGPCLASFKYNIVPSSFFPDHRFDH